MAAETPGLCPEPWVSPPGGPGAASGQRQEEGLADGGAAAGAGQQRGPAGGAAAALPGARAGGGEHGAAGPPPAREEPAAPEGLPDPALPAAPAALRADHPGAAAADPG